MEYYIPTDPEDFFDRIEEALERKDFEEAEELLAKYLECNSENTMSRLFKSLIQIGKGDLLGAITPLEEIVNTDSTNDIALKSLTNYYYMTLNCDKAIECCEKFLALDGTQTSEEAIEVRRTKVQCLYAQGKFDEALSEIDDLLKLILNDERMTVYKAKIFNRKGFYSTAIKLLNPMISVISDSELLGHAYYVLAMAYYQLGQLKRSEKLLLKSAELNDEFGVRWIKVRMAAEWEQQRKKNNNKKNNN